MHHPCHLEPPKINSSKKVGRLQLYSPHPPPLPHPTPVSRYDWSNFQKSFSSSGLGTQWKRDLTYSLTLPMRLAWGFADFQQEIIESSPPVSNVSDYNYNKENNTEKLNKMQPRFDEYFRVLISKHFLFLSQWKLWNDKIKLIFLSSGITLGLYTFRAVLLSFLGQLQDGGLLLFLCARQEKSHMDKIFVLLNCFKLISLKRFSKRISNSKHAKYELQENFFLQVDDWLGSYGSHWITTSKCRWSYDVKTWRTLSSG